MNCLLVEKVKFKLPGSSPRFIWGIVLCERQGLFLLYIPKPDDNWASSLTLAVRNPQEQCYEGADRFVFPVEGEDLEEIGAKLHAIGADESMATMRRMFQREDDF